MAALAGYRASGWSVGERLAEVIASRLRELEQLPEVVVQTYARRYGRALAGLAGIPMAMAMFASSADKELGETATHLLMAAWPAMAVAYLIGRSFGPMVLRRRVRLALAREGTAHHRLAGLEELGTSADVARRVAMRFEAWSLGLPLAALSLLMPLTLHLPFGIYFWVTGDGSFATWIVLSGIIVGHAHLFLAVAAAHFAWKLRRGNPDALKNYGWKVYGLTVLVSAVPGVVLLALPPVVTALTGLIFVPAMFAWARHVAAREREVLHME